MNKALKKFIIICLCFSVVIGTYALAVNFYIIEKSKPKIITADEAAQIDDIDAVLVLGCGIKPDNTPSVMLNERLKTGTELISKVNGGVLFLTGDNSGEKYNEVGVMKRVSIEKGVPEEKIVTDDFGFSTYESIYNAKHTFGYNKIIIVTQTYHMYRALYIAESLGIEAYGVTAYIPIYPRQIIWSTREVLARNKDFLQCKMYSMKNSHSINK